MTQGPQIAVLRGSDEPAQATARDILEEHALHWIPRAEPEDLLALGLDQLPGQARQL